VQICKQKEVYPKPKIETSFPALENIVAEPCYNYSKEARDRFFNDVYFAFMFLIFFNDGKEFLKYARQWRR
jgi:hypothetical protein